MDKQSIIGQLELDINALQRQIEDFKKHPESITSLEWELFVQRLDLMYEYCSKLKINVQPEIKEKEQRTEIISPVAIPVVQEAKESVAIVSEKKKENAEEVINTVERIVIKEEAVANQQVEMRSFQNVSATNTVEVKTTSQKLKKQTASIGGLFGDTLSLADKFKDEPTIADKIAKTKSDKSVADKLQHKPVKDLKDAIGINEKFLFINELFDGNLQDYSEALNKLNAFGNLQSAEEFIARLATQYNWGNDNDHVKNFRDLVERRFS